MKNNLEFLMAKHRVSVTQLARDIKVSRSTIYRLFDGKNPSATLMLKLANYFKVDVSDVFFASDVQHVERGKKKSTA